MSRDVIQPRSKWRPSTKLSTLATRRVAARELDDRGVVADADGARAPAGQHLADRVELGAGAELDDGRRAGLRLWRHAAVPGVDSLLMSRAAAVIAARRRWRARGGRDSGAGAR